MTNREIIRGLYESFASGDVEAVTAAFADGKATSFLQHVDTAVVRDLIE